MSVHYLRPCRLSEAILRGRPFYFLLAERSVGKQASRLHHHDPTFPATGNPISLLLMQFDPRFRRWAMIPFRSTRGMPMERLQGVYMRRIRIRENDVWTDGGTDERQYAWEGTQFKKRHAPRIRTVRLRSSPIACAYCPLTTERILRLYVSRPPPLVGERISCLSIQKSALSKQTTRVGVHLVEV